LAVSVALLLGIDHLRREARASFSSTIAGTDLIVGARSGAINLLLYSVFHTGSPTNNITWASYQKIAAQSGVAWTIPLSLGDSHRGYRVLGTTDALFEHYRFGQRQSLQFAAGQPFSGVFDVVLGAEVAAHLRYQLGDPVVVAHGMGSTSFSQHDDKPFRVTGILQATGTPMDRALLVSLAGIEAIHLDWQQGVKLPGRASDAQQLRDRDLQPRSITAFLVGLKSRALTFRQQRQINEFADEPMQAILPGVALSELWQMMRMVENLLWVISLLVMVAALVGMMTMLLASMKERRRELAVLRAVGASGLTLFWLIELEALLLCVAGMLLGLVMLTGGLWWMQDMLAARFSLFVSLNPLQADAVPLLAGLLILTAITAMIPAAAAYRQMLAQGLSARD
jgi:putative ABC transport system permease protein